MTSGKLIVITGIDGSGKTTLANRVADRLRERGIDTVYVHGRPRQVLSKPLAEIGRRVFLEHSETGTGYVQVTRKKKRLFERHALLGMGYEFVLLLDAVAQLWRSVGLGLARGKLVVCDRYYFDTVITDMSIDMNYSEEDIRRRFETLGKLLPRPNVIFLIDVDEKVAAARKNDIQSLEYLRDRRKNYALVAHADSAVTVDGEMDPQRLLAECLRRIDDEFDT